MLSLAESQGNNVLLWCDASVWFVKSPNAIFDKIEEQGCYVAEVVGDHKLGVWCSDNALDAVGFSRDDAMNIPVVYSGLYGYDLRSETGMILSSLMMKHSMDGSFIGDWKNNQRQVSQDPRCHGHRHDQSVLSALVYRLGVKADRSPGMFVMDAHEPRTEKTIAVCRGMP